MRTSSEIKFLLLNLRFAYQQFLFKYKNVRSASTTSERKQFSTAAEGQCITSNTVSKSTRQKNNTFVIPALTTERINEISAVTGISIGLCYFSWLKFSIIPSLTILEWNAKVLPDNFRTHANESDILKMAFHLKHTLPISDIYVMETFSIIGKELSEKINEIHLSSMLTVLLNGIDTVPGLKDKVFFQKQVVLKHLCGTLLGSERIPSRLVVESILENISKSGKGISQDNSNLPISIQIQPKCMDIYKESCLEKKEDLSAAFLLTLSFFEVNILRTKNSLIKQTNKGRKHDT